MGTFLVFIGKLLSCCGMCTEEEESRELLQDGWQHISNNSLSNDSNGRRALWSVRTENDVPNRSHWSSPEKMKSKLHSESSPATSQHSPSPVLLGSQKTLVRQKVISVMDQKPKEVKLLGDKEKSSCNGHLILTKKSQNPVSNKKTSCLVNGSSTNECDALKKTTLTAFLAEFRAAVDENKSRYYLNYLKAYDGSHPLEKMAANTKMESKTLERKIQDYCSSHKILLVGEGDFSFSACLAKAFGSATNMVATSLNSEEFLKRNYSEAMNNISELRKRGCRVLHEVNATAVSKHKSISHLSFDRIVYNFPHCGDFSSTGDARRKNQSLVRWFMRHSAILIKKDGEIHIRHKSNYFYQNWNLQLLATQAGLILIEDAPFDVSKFSGYNTKYGFEGGRFKSDYNFDCHPSCTYKFVRKTENGMFKICI